MVDHKRGVIFTTILLVSTLISVIEVDPRKWKKSVFTRLSLPKEEIFQFLVDARQVQKWLPLIAKIHEIDQRNLASGKRFIAEVRMAYMSQDLFSLSAPQTMDCTVTAFINNTKIEVRPKNFFYSPVVSLHLTKAKIKNMHKLAIAVYYDRNSLLFQLTLGPLLWHMMKDGFQRTIANAKTVIYYEKEQAKKEKEARDKARAYRKEQQEKQGYKPKPKPPQKPKPQPQQKPKPQPQQKPKAKATAKPKSQTKTK